MMKTWCAGALAILFRGGTDWSRPVRLGGVQAQRAFSMRPDLVRSPLPSVSGSAAVPSSVDVYVNGIKIVFKRGRRPGHIRLKTFQLITGSGVAQVVTRDASGRETVQSVSFYNSPQLLKPGLSDFSVEGGVTRSHYGIESNDYGDALFGSATLRIGITDWLTVEAHGEGGDGLVNGGAGVAVACCNRALVSAAASASTSRQGTGIQLYGSFETKVGPVSINGRAQHAFDDYEDLASMTARNTLFDLGGGGLGLPAISSRAVQLCASARHRLA